MNMTPSEIYAEIIESKNQFPMKSQERKNCVKVLKIITYAESTANLEWMKSELVWFEDHYYGPDEIVGVSNHEIIQYTIKLLKSAIVRITSTGAINMSPFNEYGNLQDPETKFTCDNIHSICHKEFKRLIESGISIQDLKAVSRDFMVSVDMACSDVVITEQSSIRNKAQMKTQSN